MKFFSRINNDKIKLAIKNSNVFRTSLFVLLFILMFILDSHSVNAQCPMCRMSAESNMANGGMAGRGLNNGILYLLALPYLIAATMIYLFRKNRKKLEQG